MGEFLAKDSGAEKDFVEFEVLGRGVQFHYLDCGCYGGMLWCVEMIFFYLINIINVWTNKYLDCFLNK